MLTLIELFDECQIENVMAGLKLMPDKIVFVGHKKYMTPARIAAVEKFFRNRSHNINFEYKTVGRYDFDSIYRELTDICINNDRCTIDITGGKEIILAATGAVAHENHIPVVQFDVRNGRFIPVMNCETMEDFPDVALNFEESVMLNGGAVVRKGSDDFEWEFSQDFNSDLEIIWNICRQNCSLWNKNIGILSAFEPQPFSGNSLEVTVSRKKLPDNYDFVKIFLDKGLLTDYYEDSDRISFRYKNENVYRALSKAGNILELYTYMLLREINLEDATFYDDILTGVVVDWDGVVYKSFRYPADTQNELDIVVMRGATPVFVSCKNGEVHKEALYELDTVADKFGGKYAKKALVCTYVTFNEKAKTNLAGRARDMKTELIHGVHSLTREEFKKLLKEKLR